MGFFDRFFQPTDPVNSPGNNRVRVGNPSDKRPSPIMDIARARFDFPSVTGAPGAPSVRGLEKRIELNGGVPSVIGGGTKNTWTYDMSSVGGSGFDIPRYFARSRGSEIF